MANDPPRQRDRYGRLAKTIVNLPLTPLGELLEEARARCGLSHHKATSRAGLSAGVWNSVIYGGHKTRGVFVANETGPGTIARLAFVVGVDIEKALKLRGFTIADVPSSVTYDLTLVATQELIDELRRRGSSTPDAAAPTEREQFEAELASEVARRKATAPTKQSKAASATRRNRAG